MSEQSSSATKNHRATSSRSATKSSWTKEYLDNLKSLALVQSRLQEQAQGVVARMERRGAAAADENFGKLADYLKTAIVEMEKAAINLGAQQPSNALPEEQKSLQQLMRAESLFREIQVSFGAQSSGGGELKANAEDLADLFELELNKLKNQYETVQRGEQQAGSTGG
jgi:DNA polymerase I-like protein with 3'-5' exonuclease and polymerase domains